MSFDSANSDESNVWSHSYLGSRDVRGTAQVSSTFERSQIKNFKCAYSPKHFWKSKNAYSPKHFSKFPPTNGSVGFGRCITTEELGSVPVTQNHFLTSSQEISFAKLFSILSSISLNFFSLRSSGDFLKNACRGKHFSIFQKVLGGVSTFKKFYLKTFQSRTNLSYISSSPAYPNRSATTHSTREN